MKYNKVPVISLERNLDRIPERHLDKFSTFLKFCFGPKSAPWGYFEMKNSGIDTENARESETNYYQNLKKTTKICQIYSVKKKLENLSKRRSDSEESGAHDAGAREQEPHGRRLFGAWLGALVGSSCGGEGAAA